MDDSELYAEAHRALVSKRYDFARTTFERLAESGLPQAWVSLGWMSEHGAGMPSNTLQAEAFYQRALELNYVPAHFYLARLLVSAGRHGDAVKHFYTAAGAGHIPSKYWLGRSYLLGRGVDRDFSKAEQLLGDAMSMGHLYARRDFYRWRLRGAFGGRRKFTDWGRWLLAMIAGLRMALTDPQSQYLQ